MRRAQWIFFAAVVAAMLVAAGRAGAVPAFARREGVTCQMCHFRPPELNEDGREYLRRGTREDSGVMKHSGEMKDMGGAPATELGEPTAIQWSNYLSMIADPGITHVENGSTAFDAGGLDLLVGGPFDRHWSALANPVFEIEDGGAGVEQGWGMYISDWTRTFQSVRFGQVLPFAILLNQGDVALSLSTPLVLSQPIEGGSGWTPTTLLRGAELGMVDGSQWNASVGVGQPRFENTVEGDPHTDVYGSAEYLLTPQGTSLTGYGYWGRVGGRDFHRFGAFANFYHRTSTKAVAGFLAGSDEAGDGADLDNNGFFVVGEQLLTDRWAAYARYDRMRQDLPEGAGKLTVSGPALGASFWAQTHVWLTGEARFLDSSPGDNSNTYSFRFTWAM